MIYMNCKTCFKPCDTTSGYCSIGCMSTSLSTDNNSHTCTPTERAFLDEIREKGRYNRIYDAIEIGESTIIYNEDFQWALIKELVNE